jgi:hypothetical protein
MIEGFCTAHGDDVPVTADRRCAQDGDLAIPPSWARQGAPYPWPTRPEGWTWTPPAAPEPKVQVPKAAPIAPPAPKKAPSPPKRRAKPSAPSQPVMVTLSCEACHVVVTKRFLGGPKQRFCSSRCRNKGRGPRPAGMRTTPMSAFGRRCLDCGRDDRPHRARGLCPICDQRARRRAQKAAAV